MKRVKEEYNNMVYDRQQLQNVALKDLQFTISDQSFLDVLSMEIRSKTIVYSLKKKKDHMEKNKHWKKRYSTGRTKLICPNKRLGFWRGKKS